MTHPQAPARPDGIPQDVWDAALRVLSDAVSDPEGSGLGLIDVIARAIMAERQRCAAKVENWVVEGRFAIAFGRLRHTIAANLRSEY